MAYSRRIAEPLSNRCSHHFHPTPSGNPLDFAYRQKEVFAASNTSFTSILLPAPCKGAKTICSPCGVAVGVQAQGNARADCT